MAREIALTLYFVEPAFLYNGDLSNKVTMVVNRALRPEQFEFKEVNRANARTVAGVPYLYSQIILNPSGLLNGDAYAMQTVSQIVTAINAGN